MKTSPADYPVKVFHANTLIASLYLRDIPRVGDSVLYNIGPMRVVRVTWIYDHPLVHETHSEVTVSVRLDLADC